MNQAFLQQIEELSEVEEKLKTSIAFMRDALAQEGSPNFKGFWDVRKFCLPLFKEPIAGPVRAQLWGDYIELTREGRRLKNLLDEETAFAVEQIELAISGLEKEVAAFHEQTQTTLSKAAPIELPPAHTLERRGELFCALQTKLNILNVQAAHINSLRKELIGTEMRIRQKNQFFQRLSKLGDHVFPVRKELIREVSEAFMAEVDAFVQNSFGENSFDADEVRRSVFRYRDEIKALQAAAKLLTLNTHAFSETRKQLSGCWDQLKGMEKERKKEMAEHKQQSADNASEVAAQIEAADSLAALDQIANHMRDVQLVRVDVQRLKEQLVQARVPFEEKNKQKQQQFEQERKEKVEAFKGEVAALEQKIASTDISLLNDELESVRKAFGELSMLKVDRQQIEQQLKGVRDQITEKQEQAVLNLSDDAKASLDQLESVLQQRLDRRKEIKTQIEEYRKLSGSSSLDFEKAMEIQEQLNSEKERLTKLDAGIVEIETKICELKQ